MMDSLAVVIPCLNEAENLRGLLPRVFATLSTFDTPFEVVVVDGGSVDATAEVAGALGAKVMQQRGTGYGGAIRTAFEDIDATWIITLDADYSHPPAFLRYLWAARNTGEIVIASRRVPGGHGAMPWSRVFLSGTLNRTFRTLLSMPVCDLSSGYRLYRRKAVVTMDLRFSTYAILQEILVKAYCQGYRVREIPFHYRPRRHGSSHARLFRFGRDYLAALRIFWRLRNSIESVDYDARAFTSLLPPQRWWHRWRYRALLDMAGETASLLDAGCGTSAFMEGAPQAIGLDHNHARMRYLRRAGRELVTGDAVALPFADGAFDAIVCSQVLQESANPAAIVRELARCVRPGGHVVLGVTDASSPMWRALRWLYGKIHPMGYVWIQQSDLPLTATRTLVAQAGLVVEEERSLLGAECILKASKPISKPTP